MLQEDGRFIVPKSAGDIASSLVELTSPISGFVCECCDLINPDTRESQELTSVRDIFGAYREWCRETNRPCGPENLFGRNLQAAFPVVKAERPRGGEESRPRRYRGIILNSTGDRYRDQASVSRWPATDPFS